MNSLSYIALFLSVFLYPTEPFVSRGDHPELIVWYVGQGQMVTYSNEASCYHFDMGGEQLPLKELVRECRRKNNFVFFSHWDWDHINFAGKVRRQLPSLCRVNDPGGKGSKKKRRFLFKIPKCKTNEKNPPFKEITFSPQVKDRRARMANKMSKVVVLLDQVLIPGDSPGSLEKIWVKKISAKIEILILAHHGSRNSTSEPFLAHFKYLKTAIASARRKRYGHPHPMVKKRLAKRGVPLLSTELFRHIRIPLKGRVVR